MVVQEKKKGTPKKLDTKMVPLDLMGVGQKESILVWKWFI